MRRLKNSEGHYCTYDSSRIMGREGRRATRAFRLSLHLFGPPLRPVHIVRAHPRFELDDPWYTVSWLDYTSCLFDIVVFGYLFTGQLVRVIFSIFYCSRKVNRRGTDGRSMHSVFQPSEFKSSVVQ